MSDEQGSITRYLQKLGAGDSIAIQQVWERYFRQLIGLVGRRFPVLVRRPVDEEDVALSAFHSFLTGLAEGRFPQMDDRDALWNVLAVITTRKAQEHIRHSTRQKRGGGKVIDQTALAGASSGDDSTAFDFVSEEPPPELVVEVAEEYERLLDLLGDDEIRSVALLKM